MISAMREWLSIFKIAMAKPLNISQSMGLAITLKARSVLHWLNTKKQMKTRVITKNLTSGYFVASFESDTPLIFLHNIIY